MRVWWTKFSRTCRLGRRSLVLADIARSIAAPRPLLERPSTACLLQRCAWQQHRNTEDWTPAPFLIRIARRKNRMQRWLRNAHATRSSFVGMLLSRVLPSVPAQIRVPVCASTFTGNLIPSPNYSNPPLQVRRPHTPSWPPSYPPLIDLQSCPAS